MTPHLKKDPHNEPTNRTVGNKLYIEARPDAQECKSNVGRDYEKTDVTTDILKQELKCDVAHIVVPFPSEIIETGSSNSVEIIPVSELSNQIDFVIDISKK